jgi:hypothetical protein
MDRRTAQGILRAALKRRHAPGKYDVFAWYDGPRLSSITVAWRSYTKRAIALEDANPAFCGGFPTNGAPLPNGIEKNCALCVGTFRAGGIRDDEDVGTG